MAGGDFINVPAAGQRFDGPEIFVPAATENPVAGSGRLHLGADALAKFVERFHAGEIDVHAVEAAIFQMCVGVVEAGHNEMAAEIDDLSIGPAKLEHFGVLADGLNAVPAHGHGFGALDGLEGRHDGHTGIDVSVREDDIGLRLHRLLLRLHAKGAQQDESNCKLHYSPTPASASSVSNIRLSPSSRPLQSNHSCKV